MRRFTATMLLDLRLQWRNGFYYAAGLVAVVTIVILRYVPGAYLEWVLPPVLLNNLLVGTFYFLGGMVLLEKREGTTEVQVVTPLRPGEYLLSKVVTLTALSVLENVSIVLFGVGFDVNVLVLGTGIALSAVLFCLIGFVFVARYDSINEYLMPSTGFALVLFLPLLDYFEVWQSPAFLLHPVQGTLMLLVAAFEPVDGWVWVYGLVYPAVWIYLAFLMSRRAFDRFVVGREGVH